MKVFTNGGQRAKLSELDVELILELRDAGLTYAANAGKWDDGAAISPSTVRDICKGITRWQEVARYTWTLEKRKDGMQASCRDAGRTITAGSNITSRLGSGLPPLVARVVSFVTHQHSLRQRHPDYTGCAH
jgi:hypothetical protein